MFPALMGTGEGSAKMKKINILAAEKRESEDPFEGGAGQGWKGSSQQLPPPQDLVASLQLVWICLGFFSITKHKRSHL